MGQSMAVGFYCHKNITFKIRRINVVWVLLHTLTFIKHSKYFVVLNHRTVSNYRFYFRYDRF
jgi:hypothetical protein